MCMIEIKQKNTVFLIFFLNFHIHAYPIHLSQYNVFN